MSTAPIKRFLFFSRHALCLALFVLAFNGCQSGQQLVLPSDPGVRSVGRFDKQDPASYRFWYSGSKIEATYVGKKLVAVLDDAEGNNYFNIVVDGQVDSIRKVRLAKGSNKLTLYESPGVETHTVEIFKLTEFVHGHTDFKGFEVDGRVKVCPQNTAKPLIVFYGDSITCGMGTMDESREQNEELQYWNHYLSYAAIAGRELGADHHSISRSGIGFSVSWFNQIMPELYDRLDPNDPDSRWDFAKSSRDLVVVNLGQNDCWITKLTDNPEYQRRFGDQPMTDELLIERYQGFIQSLVAVYPGTPIICALGNMDATQQGSPWPGYIQQACANIQQADPSVELYTTFFPDKQTKGHPVVEEQQAMADQLVDFIQDRELLKK